MGSARLNDNQGTLMTVASFFNHGTKGLYGVALVLVVLAVRDRVTAYTRRPVASGLAPIHLPRGSVDPALFYQMSSESPRLGPDDAPVVIVEFVNYLCGHCVEFSATIAAIRKRYPDEVAVVVKNLLYDPDRNERLLHEGAECAAEQGRFREYYTAMFDGGARRLTHEPWRDAADSIRMPDMHRFVICARSEKYRTALLRDADEAATLAVTGTPISFLNGIRIVGAMPFDQLNELVASQLGRKLPQGAHDTGQAISPVDTVRRDPDSRR